MSPASARIEQHCTLDRASLTQRHLPSRVDANGRFGTGTYDLHIGRLRAIEQQGVETFALYLQAGL